jgi:hypothetical protein
MKAIQVVLSCSESPEEIMRLFELHEVVAEMDRLPAFVLGVYPAPGEVVAMENARNEGAGGRPEANQAELGDELDFEDPVDDVTAEEIARDSGWANDADAIDAIKPEVEDDDPDSHVLPVELRVKTKTKYYLQMVKSSADRFGSL